jgi:hypothetical protein
MLEDPKDPNAWWGVRLKLIKLPPEKLTPTQKRNLVWIAIPWALLVFGSLYYLSRHLK